MPPKASHFLTWPLELRRHIYRATLVSTTRLKRIFFTKDTHLLPTIDVNLLCTNDQVFREAIEVFYTENSFFILADELSDGVGNKWLASCNVAYRRILDAQLRLMRNVTVVYWAQDVVSDYRASARLRDLWVGRDDMRRIVVEGYVMRGRLSGRVLPVPTSLGWSCFGPLFLLRNVKEVEFRFGFVRVDGMRWGEGEVAKAMLDGQARIMMGSRVVGHL